METGQLYRHSTRYAQKTLHVLQLINHTAVFVPKGSTKLEKYILNHPFGRTQKILLLLPFRSRKNFAKSGNKLEVLSLILHLTIPKQREKSIEFC